MLTIHAQKKIILKLEKKIASRVEMLGSVGAMRPGSLNKQYRDKDRQKGIYYQLSYTHKMRSRTEHVWLDHVPGIKKEIAEYKKFKKLTTEVIALSIELSKARIALLRMQSKES
jgi:hypothetical protein